MLLEKQSDQHDKIMNLSPCVDKVNPIIMQIPKEKSTYITFRVKSDEEDCFNILEPNYIFTNYKITESTGCDLK